MNKPYATWITRGGHQVVLLPNNRKLFLDVAEADLIASAINAAYAAGKASAESESACLSCKSPNGGAYCADCMAAVLAKAVERTEGAFDRRVGDLP